MKKLGIITCTKFPDLYEYDKDIKQLLSDEGFETEIVIWDNPELRIEDYDIMLMRSAWDYYYKPYQFKDFLERVKSSGIKCFNPAEVMLENMHKFYLKKIKEWGFDIIPTMFFKKDEDININEVLSFMDGKSFIVKPAISAASFMTKLFDKETEELHQHIKEITIDRDILFQKFIPEIQELGEYSNIFFSNGYKYSVQKMPVSGDYRVQNTYGGVYKQIEVPEIVKQTAQRLADKYLSQCLYVRVDGVLHNNKFLIMEVEMIEPDLYMNIIPEAKREFIDSIKENI
jgi:glutathione synthase/RimK-type ligase-like ATP-grasp enzyme